MLDKPRNLLKQGYKMLIRAYATSDLDTLFAINQAGVPGVGNETKTSLETWINLSTAFIAADEKNTPLGFLTVIEPGTKRYDSENLRWFEAYLRQYGGDLIYVDRIAVAETARGQNIGERLYKAAFEAFASRQQIGCEVNIQPPNPGSMRFHARLGFKRIGERSYDRGRKSVAYYVRPLSDKGLASNGLP